MAGEGTARSGGAAELSKKVEELEKRVDDLTKQLEAVKDGGDAKLVARYLQEISATLRDRLGGRSDGVEQLRRIDSTLQERLAPIRHLEPVRTSTDIDERAADALQNLQAALGRVDWETPELPGAGKTPTGQTPAAT